MGERSSPLFGPFAFVFAFFSALRGFPGTLDVALGDHEGPTARTRTYSRELGCIPCPESSDSKTTETDVALADLGHDVVCWFGCRGVHFLEAGDERVGPTHLSKQF